MSLATRAARLLVCLCVGPLLSAQNGSNFLVLSNGFDAIYAGLGAGGNQVAGVDGFGLWLHGESMRGSTRTVTGDYGYREAARRESLCVLGAASSALALDFPLLLTVEFDGVNPWTDGSVFTTASCPAGGLCFPLGTSAGFVPYGSGPGASASFVRAGLPSALGVPSATTVLLPNVGLVPSSNGGTATVIAAAAATLPIGSTGLCWVVQFDWAPSALASLDDINGWWTWRTNGRGGNQYWGVSTDELGLWQSQTVATDGGQSALQAFFANLDYETHSLSVNPVTNDALAPVGANGTGVYYATGAGVPNSGNSFNGGFDLGQHGGWALDGDSGSRNPITGLSNQDPAGSPVAGLAPSMGFVSWSNGPLTTPTRNRIVLLQVDFDMTFGVDPAQATDVQFVFNTVRKPLRIPASAPNPWPQSLTLSLLTLFAHDMPDQTGVAGWPDPSGFVGGSFGVAPFVGSSVHIPMPFVATNLGVPVGLDLGSSSTNPPMFVGKFGSGTGSPSVGSTRPITGN